MQVKLKRKCELNGKVYPAGTHDLPDSLSNHWFFKGLQKDGSAVVLGAQPVAATVIKDDDHAAPPAVTVLGEAPLTADADEESADGESTESDETESDEESDEDDSSDEVDAEDTEEDEGDKPEQVKKKKKTSKKSKKRK